MGNYYSDNDKSPPKSSGDDHPQYKRVETECDFCGEKIEVQPYKLEKNKRTFCNNDCRSSWQSNNIVGENHHQYLGSENYYGENWHQMRRKCIEKYNSKCNRCDVNKKEHKKEYGCDLSVHHKIEIRKFDAPEDANYIENLELLCKKCHSEEHKKRRLGSKNNGGGMESGTQTASENPVSQSDSLSDADVDRIAQRIVELQSE